MRHQGNVFFFESDTMRGLFEAMRDWEAETRRQLASISVERDGDGFCCIALSGPIEVIEAG